MAPTPQQFIHSGGEDFTSVSDSFTLSDDAQIQCVPISITSDSTEEPGEECFT